MAEESVVDEVDEIVVIGSRRRANVITTSPVTVDILRGDLFRNIGTFDMDDVLRTLIPAYNVGRFPLNDPTHPSYRPPRSIASKCYVTAQFSDQ